MALATSGAGTRGGARSTTSRPSRRAPESIGELAPRIDLHAYINGSDAAEPAAPIGSVGQGAADDDEEDIEEEEEEEEVVPVVVRKAAPKLAPRFQTSTALELD